MSTTDQRQKGQAPGVRSMSSLMSQRVSVLNQLMYHKITTKAFNIVRHRMLDKIYRHFLSAHKDHIRTQIRAVSNKGLNVACRT